jgi:iron complex transport system permease protein
MAAMDFKYVSGNADHVVFSVIAEKTQIPLNVISSVFGIPVILMMLLKQNKV